MPLTPGARRRALSTLLPIALIATIALQGLAAAQPLPLEADDAGSGRDAGFTFETAVPVQLDTTYTGTMAPGLAEYILVPTDLFTFEATAGQDLSIWLEADGVVCADVVDVTGDTVAEGTCLSGTIALPVTADATLGLKLIGTPDPVTDYTFRIDSRPTFPAPSAVPTGDVVVAVQSPNGVNPYHEVYRRPSMTSHPCTRVDGFTDCTIPALELTLDGVDSLEEAVAADAEVWDSVVPGQWYWVPGTNIIGAACSQIGSTNGCVLGTGGTPSAVLSEAPDALLLVADSGVAPSQAFASAPVVPDLQTGGAPTAFNHLVERGNDAFDNGVAPTPADTATLLFQAAPSTIHGPAVELETVTASPEVQVVTGTRPGTLQPQQGVAADFASYSCRPVASGSALTGTANSCGADDAPVTAAGAAAAALQTLRAQDGSSARSTGSSVSPTVSREAFVEGLRAAASYDPEPKYGPGLVDDGVDIPAGQEHLSYGYGWLDGDVAGAIVDCIRDTATCPGKSTESVLYNDARRQSREVAPVLLENDPSSSVASDDAGSGRDAGDDLATAVAVDLGTAYAGSLVPLPGGALAGPFIRVPGDTDWYTFQAEAGQQVDVTLTQENETLVACLEIRDAGGTVLAAGCGSELSALIPATGTYVFEVGYAVTADQPYGFTVS